MGPLEALQQNLGLATLTVLTIGLCAYLVFSMVHPEWF